MIRHIVTILRKYYFEINCVKNYQYFIKCQYFIYLFKYTYIIADYKLYARFCSYNFINSPIRASKKKSV